MSLRRAIVLPLVALATLSTGAAACSAILGLEPPPTGDGGTLPFDATTGDALSGGDSAPASDGPVADQDGGPDASSDSPAACVPLDGGGDGSTTYFSLSQALVDDAGDHTWQYFEPNTVNANSHDFQGGAFDGRYVYFAPSSNGTVTRYDTHVSFTGSGSWSTFDTSTLSADAQGFGGAVYDGRFVYFVPYHTAAGGYLGLLVRYDTFSSFLSATSWSTFDMSTLAPDGGSPTIGFSSGVFDGHAVYFTPYYDGIEHTSRVVRYIPLASSPDGGVDGGVDGGARDGGSAPAMTAAQFSSFDMSTRDNSAAGYLGAVFDGRYVYEVPYNSTTLSGIVARYDTDASFVSGSSWTFYDDTAVNAGAAGFVGGAFDTRYVYFVPHTKSVVARYDSQTSALDTKTAWSTFDLTAVVASTEAGPPDFFSGAAFDGRFVYLIPAATGVVVRYDTLSPFTSACAWSLHDMSQDVASAVVYYGAVYDGQYLYLVPKGTWVARFDTKVPPSMPPLPAYNGSFY
jgi:hypothetical protein